MRAITELAIREKRVLIRTDFNVSLKEDGTVADDTRIVASLPTIKHALDYNCRIIIASHIGNPRGTRNQAFSLEPVGARLAELLDREIVFFEDCIGMGAQQMVRDLKPGNILLLENLRFYEGEENNETGFARMLAKLCDVYINDAFAVSHREHASVSALPSIMEDKAAGILMLKEHKALSNLLRYSRGDGFTVVMGGANISDKIALIRSFLSVADKIIIGGAMAYTFLAAKGINVGTSFVEQDKISIAQDIIKGAEVRGVKLVLPVDHIVAKNIDEKEGYVFSNDNFPENLSAYDIGPATEDLFSEEIRRSNAVFWNGPMGASEKEPFTKGSLKIAKAIAGSEAYTVAGGGDTVAIINMAGVGENFDHISTGGGASLAFLKKGTLPAIDILNK